MKADKYACQFAPDGEHFVTNHKLTLEKAWAWLTGPEARLHVKLLPNARVRLVNLITGAVIGDK